MSTSGLQEPDRWTHGRYGFVAIARGIIPSAQASMRPMPYTYTATRF